MGVGVGVGVGGMECLVYNCAPGRHLPRIVSNGKVGRLVVT